MHWGNRPHWGHPSVALLVGDGSVRLRPQEVAHSAMRPLDRLLRGCGAHRAASSQVAGLRSSYRGAPDHQLDHQPWWSTLVVNWRRCCHNEPLQASDLGFRVEAMGLEPTNLLTASQALYQLSYAPSGSRQASSTGRLVWPTATASSTVSAGGTAEARCRGLPRRPRGPSKFGLCLTPTTSKR